MKSLYLEQQTNMLLQNGSNSYRGFSNDNYHQPGAGLNTMEFQNSNKNRNS